MIYLLKNIKSITSQPNITLLTDVDVDNGTVFEKKHSGNNIAVTNNGGCYSHDKKLNYTDIIKEELFRQTIRQRIVYFELHRC
jgi:hypothetical protein